MKDRENAFDAVKEYLIKRGYSNFVTETLPRGIDMSAQTDDGNRHSFAISVLTPNSKNKCFGSTNTSEWRFEKGHNSKVFFIVVAIDQNGYFIDMLDPDSILKISTSISFKITFDALFKDGQIVVPKSGKYKKDTIYRLLDK